MAVAKKEILSHHPRLIILPGGKDTPVEVARIESEVILFSAVRDKIVKQNGYKNPDGSFHEGLSLAPQEIENKLRVIAEKRIFGRRKKNEIARKTEYPGKESITIYEVDPRSKETRRADLRIIAKACHVEEKQIQRQHQKGRIGDGKFAEQMEAIEGQRLAAQTELFPGVFYSISRNKKLRPKKMTMKIDNQWLWTKGCLKIINLLQSLSLDS